MGAGSADCQPHSHLGSPLLHPESKNAEEPDAAEEKCNRREKAAELGDQSFAAEGLVDLIRQRQKDHVPGVRRKASQRAAIGADGVTGGPTADKEDKVVVVSACRDRGLRCRKVDRGRRWIAQRRVASILNDTHHAAVGRELAHAVVSGLVRDE